MIADGDPLERFMYYAVVQVVTGDLLYAGPNLTAAADYLVPGTTFGKAENLEEAKDQAFRRAAKLAAAVEKQKEKSHVRQ